MANHIFINPPFNQCYGLPFHQCHGSTLVELPDGSIAVAWFAGTREGLPDTAIWWCRQRHGKWERPRVVAKCDEQAHWNPVLYPVGDGTTILYFKTGRFPDSWDTWVCKLSVNGKIIKKPKMLESIELPIGRMTPGPVRGKMIETSSGALIAPSSIEKILDRRIVNYHVQSDVKWESVIHRSSDQGKTWNSIVIPFVRQENELGGIIQPSVWEVSEGHLAAFFRSTNEILYRSESHDDGITWTSAIPTNIPNPNSAVDVARNGDIVALIYNPTAGNWTRRSPLSVAFDGPEGTSFNNPVHIEDGPGNYSYPAIIATSYGFAATYTWNRRAINFVKILISDGKPVIEDGPEPYVFDSDSV